LFSSSCRHADTGVLNLAPLKLLALSARVMPSEPRPQPPYAEPLPVQVEEGLAVATVVEESVVPPPPVTATVVEEERAIKEMAAPQAALGPPAGASSGGEDLVMVLANSDLAPPPPAREHDVAMLAVLESSAVAAAASIEGAAGTSSSRYVDFPSIGIIDLDTTELPSNDRVILEVATDRMFAEPSILDAIASVPSVPRQHEGAGSLAPLPRRRRVVVVGGVFSWSP
jgi:hypothetical protein